MSLCSSANRVDVLGCSGSMLIQAIRSHIYFSQLSAWLSRSKGSVPSQVIYRSVPIWYNKHIELQFHYTSDTSHLYGKTIFMAGIDLSTGNFSEKKNSQWINFRGLWMIMIRKCYHLLFHTVSMFLLWRNMKQWQMKLDRGSFYQNVFKFCQMVHTHLVSSSLNFICTVPVGRKLSLSFRHTCRWKVVIMHISLLITAWLWQLTLSPLFVFICVYLQCQCKDVWGSFSWPVH